jgi:cell division protein FtsQ
MAMFGNRKPRNRKRTEEAAWQMPQIDWKRLASATSGLAVVGAFLWLIVTALDQPIDRVLVQGRFQRVSPMEVEQAVRDRLHDAGLVTADLATLQRAIETLPWVDSASVGRAWPRGLEVRVVEQVAAARWGANGLLNARGELFLSESRFIPPELPRLSGPKGSESTVAQRYLAIQGRLIEGGVRIRLGRRQVDERFERFVAAALRLVVQRSAEINYVDMRYTNGFSVGWRGSTKVAAVDEFDESTEG